MGSLSNPGQYDPFGQGLELVAPSIAEASLVSPSTTLVA
jgi:hypothetical protein